MHDHGQVFARDSRLPDTAPLVYLPPGAAEQRRDDARAGHLICPLPGSPSPAFTTPGGDRRHGFVHRPESVTLHTGKHLPARWLRNHDADAAVHIDDTTIAFDVGSDADAAGQRPAASVISRQSAPAVTGAVTRQADHA